MSSSANQYQEMLGPSPYRSMTNQPWTPGAHQPRPPVCKPTVGSNCHGTHSEDDEQFIVFVKFDLI